MATDSALDRPSVPYPPRARRRYHRDRLKRRWAQSWRWGQYHQPDVAQLGRMATTHTPCSDACCGNPRRHFGERSVQERRADETAGGALCADLRGGQDA